MFLGAMVLLSLQPSTGILYMNCRIVIEDITRVEIHCIFYFVHKTNNMFVTSLKQRIFL